jgi:hypothetical protein
MADLIRRCGGGGVWERFFSMILYEVNLYFILLYEGILQYVF